MSHPPAYWLTTVANPLAPSEIGESNDLAIPLTFKSSIVTQGEAWKSFDDTFLEIFPDPRLRLCLRAASQEHFHDCRMIHLQEMKVKIAQKPKN
jgi:hypothetical protein